MTQVPIEMLKTGMTTASEVQNRRGQVLVPGGIPITERHLRGMKIWGIEYVDVLSDELDVELLSHALPVPIAPDTTELSTFLEKLFRYNRETRDHPFMIELYAHCEDTYKRRGIPEFQNRIISESGASASGSPPARRELLSIAALLKSSKDLASPPNIYQRLMTVMGQTGSSSSRIAAVIENDPGLTGRLLQIVNSAFYSFPSPIETISRAITIVGTDELRNMVLVTSVIKRFSKGLEGILDMEAFWKHSICCALFSRQIATMRNDPNAERFFTSGLLHDIGKLIMYLQMPEEMAMLLQDDGSERDPYRDERIQFGFTHAQVGKELTENWRLSPRQSESIQFHHTPLGAKRFPLDTAILHVADVLSHAMQIGSSGGTAIPQFNPDAWEQLRFSEDALSRMTQDVEREVSELIRIFYVKDHDKA
jgi:HD-like signal output (HDOD) protein